MAKERNNTQQNSQKDNSVSAASSKLKNGNQASQNNYQGRGFQKTND